MSELPVKCRKEESSAQDRACNVCIDLFIVTCQKYSVQFNLPYCWFSSGATKLKASSQKFVGVRKRVANFSNIARNNTCKVWRYCRVRRVFIQCEEII